MNLLERITSNARRPAKPEAKVTVLFLTSAKAMLLVPE
jgi:hypothetical protein